METDKNALDNIPFSEPGTMIDARKYRGLRVKLAKADIIEVTDWYTGPKDDKGMPTYNKESKEMKKVVVVTTEPIPKLDNNNQPTSEKTDITVDRRFNLKKEVNESTNAVSWSISKADRAKLWAFMRNLECEKLSDLIGKDVVLSTEADTEDPKKFWLRIAD